MFVPRAVYEVLKDYPDGLTAKKLLKKSLLVVCIHFLQSSLSVLLPGQFIVIVLV